jgi:hypothetical protein
MAKFFRGDKRRREMDRKRRGEEKQRRLQLRREMRAKGLDPDTVDAQGNPLPVAESAQQTAPEEERKDGDEPGGEAPGGES